jgi:SAM-dependent methyltransferase
MTSSGMALTPYLSAAPPGLIGPVLNYAGDAGIRLTSRRDVSVVGWVWENLDAFDAFCRAVRQRPERGREAAREVLRAHPAEGLTGEDLVEFANSGDIMQILNDVRALRTDDESRSETLQFMLETAGISAESAVLDVGCSCGRHIRQLTARSPRLLAGVDVNLLALLLGARAWAAAGLATSMHWCWADALRLPFRDGVLTHVNSFVTLSFLPLRAALTEVGRVLRPGGRLTMSHEGPGYWTKRWIESDARLRPRVNLLRERVGSRLLAAGVDWQRFRLTGRLARHVQLDPRGLAGLVERAGFDVDRIETLRPYGGRAWIIGLSARKRDRHEAGDRSP